MTRFAWIALAIAAVAASPARAAPADPPIATSQQPRPYIPAEPEPPLQRQPPEPTAADTTSAPAPDASSGRIDVEPGDSAGRRLGRAVLYVPKLLFEVLMFPLGEGIYLESRYQLSDWYYRLLYNKDLTIGVVPTATYETGYGLTVGARAFDLDTFGRNETVVLQATVGTTYRVGLLASADTGDRLGPVKLGIAGNFDRRPAEPFYGIGNTDDLVDPVPGEHLDAQNAPNAVHSTFRYQEARASAFADYRVYSDLHLVGLGAYTELKYTPSTADESIQHVYDPMTVTGFDQTTKHFYGELDVAWDTRHRATVWEPVTVNSHGSLVLGFAGYSQQLENGPGFWHYGGELQHYFRLGFGPRVLVARLRGEAVSGGLSEVPITELPMLGGGDFLRGYDYARFRDRLAGVGTLQYMWPLFSYGSAYLFTDVGRVWRSWDALTLANLNAGFGVGLELYTSHAFMTDLAIASSIDGGVFLTAEFSPVLDARPRWR